jgi:ligand-binding sensor domain-containing protein
MNKISKILSCLTVVFFLQFTYIYSQQLTIKHFTTKDGLPHIFVNHIFEDSRGFYWASTQGGLGCYTGKEWKTYTKKAGLPGSDITFSAEDKDGNIWIATNGYGISKFDGIKFKNYNSKNGFKNEIVYCILIDTKNRVWFATYGGIIVFENDKFTTYTTKDGLPTNEYYSIAEDKNGNIWAGSRGYGLIKYDGKKFINYTMEDGLSDNTIFALFSDSKNNLWIGTVSGGMNIFDGKKIKALIDNSDPNYINEFVGGIVEDANGNIWFASDRRLCKISHDRKSIVSVFEKNGLSSNNILSLESSSDGNILVGTDNGFDVLFPDAPYKFKKEDGISGEKVTAVFKDSRGNFLIGTSGQGVTVKTSSEIYHLNYIKQIANSKVLCIFEDSKGRIWIGFDRSDYGVVVLEYKNGQYIFSKYINSINDHKFNSVTSVLEDNHGNIWIGAYGSGIIVIDKEGKMIHYNDKNKLPSNDIMYMFKDSEQNIWISITQIGVLKYNNSEFIKYSTKNGLKENSIFSICEGKGGEIIFGYAENGMSIFNKEAFHHFDTEDGIISNLTLSIDVFSINKIIVGTDIGFYILDYSNLENPKVIIDPVLEPVEINQNALQIYDDKYYIGTTDGLLTGETSRYKKKIYIPKIYLEKLELIYNKINWNDHTNKFDSFTGIGLHPVFNYDQNNLKFTFTITGLIDKYKFQYLLVGLNSEWSAPSKSNDIFYNGLRPGKYILKVRATDGRGNYSYVFTYDFTIQPAYWQTWWFQISAGCTLILSLFLFIKSRSRLSRIRQQELEQTVKEKTRQLNHQKELIEEKQKEITDSINYAKRIQYSLLAHQDLLKSNLPEVSVFFKPKDIVSGDFYWASKKVDDENILLVKDEFGKTIPLIQSTFYLAVCDSTGHGIPGAFMSLLNISLALHLS